MAVAIAATPALAQEQIATIDIPAQPMDAALKELARQSGANLLFSLETVKGLQAHAVQTSATPEAAARMLLAGTDLSVIKDSTGSLIVERADPQGGSAAGGADGTVQALVVTAQKREENIQDVPIAMSAFTQEDLTRSQVAGGPDLMTQVPNFTFTKTNFSGYSIQIRGIGTQAISATTDAAVAVAFNNTPFIRNRFFEQEFYDLQRVEVLRGPQGTLYGRNATAGVVNIISAKPTFHYEAKLSADLGNYNSQRFEGMINVPLVDDKVALRLAGAWTKRDGYDTNQVTGNRIDGRNLWSTRLSLRFEPTDNIHANLIWEHFQENDDRLRSGKQLCHTHEVTSVAGFPTPNHDQTLPEQGQPALFAGVQATFSQGCIAASLYAPESFETPNGLSLPYYQPLAALYLPAALDDPYLSSTQSRDLRVIESTVDPKYHAKTDTVELQFNLDLPNNLTLTSETGYLGDVLFSMEDYNRFNTAPGAFTTSGFNGENALATGLLDANGTFCDPQIGCSNRLIAVDLSTAKSRHFSQEFRLSSDFSGPVNFSLGGNLLRYDTEDKYYVFINSLTLTSFLENNRRPYYTPGVSDNHECLLSGFQLPDPNTIYTVTNACIYVDPNPISSLNDMGHNYFLSKNPYKLISYAVFGEGYYNISDNLKLTAGVRWTVDKKEAPRIPSWVLSGGGIVVEGNNSHAGAGYPIAEVIEQEWREPTGRLTLDWKPKLSFTDETLVYGSIAHGYKAGGANPPAYGVAVNGGGSNNDLGQVLAGENATHPKTFDPEFVNAYEVGSKNTLLDGKLTLNIDGFYYDYTGYQISQIVDRAAVNLNFDAKIWGLELESDWRPLENLRLGLKVGYEKTRMADGSKAVDLMDRTAGHADWVVVSPFPSFPSNCILPSFLFVGSVGGLNGMNGPDPQLVNLGNPGGGGSSGCELAYVLGLDPVTRLPYVPNPTVANGDALGAHPGYPGWNPATAPNSGAGFYKDLSGHELPNAPHYTATLTADYTLPLPSDWLMTLHTDLYYQSEAWTRIFNTPGYDKLKAYTNVNLAAIFSNEDAGWKVMAYIKNVFDRDSITGAFLNSDDTGLTTNVFLTEPRLYGLRVTKEWTGKGWWTGANPNHPAGEPYPIVVELGGQVQRQDAPYSVIGQPSLAIFADTTNPIGIQNRTLDWGQDYSVKVTYQPSSAQWRVSGSFRYGRTNGGDARFHGEAPADSGCLVGSPYEFFCQNPNFVYSGAEFTDATVRNREEHTLLDFLVGRDVGLGSFGKSSVSVGIQYARLDSRTAFRAHGLTNWNIADYWAFFKYNQHDVVDVDMKADRSFKGAGPKLSWNAAERLLGSNDTGLLSLDWSVGGGVLFGRQKTSLTGAETIAHYDLVPKYSGFAPPRGSAPPQDITSVVIAPRSRSASVPVLDLSVGLTYEIQRVKVGAGYRWERYFNAVDAGYAEHKSYDRTFDGPYFKIAVGFGG